MPVQALKAPPRRRVRAPTWQEVAEGTPPPEKPPSPAPASVPVTRETLRAFINRHCIKRAPPGSKELPSLEDNGFYEWQFYLRSAVLVPQFLAVIANTFWTTYRARFAQSPFQIAGVEQASLPIVTAILLFGAHQGIPVRAFTIRKERKTYGLRNIIEGQPGNLPVVIIDDLTSEYHRSMWHALHVLGSSGLRPYPACFVLVRKQKKTDTPIIPSSLGNITIESMFTLDDFNLSYDIPSGWNGGYD